MPVPGQPPTSGYGSLAHVVSLVNRWLEFFEPECRLKRLILELDDGRKLKIPCRPQPVTPPAEESGCRADVLALLKTATRRMTGSEIQTELERRGKLWAERTVKGVLADLVEEGSIDNDGKARPRGYQLCA